MTKIPGTLKPDPNNANKGTQRGLGMVERSLEQYGAGRSILASADDVILAGNKTYDRAMELGIPVRIIESDGHELVVVKRTDLQYADPRAKELAIADNRASETGLSWDTDMLQALAADGVKLDDFWYEGELADLLDQQFDGEGGGDGAGEPENEEAEERGSSGELLALVDVTIAEPTHTVSKGDIWEVGTHLLVCADVLTGWAAWAGELTEGDVFCPYPGPFTPLTNRAERSRLVMVQPSTYIAGHILDRYIEVKGSANVRRRD